MAKAAPLAKQAIPIERQIYKVRGRRVMLDSDLAGLYGVTTSSLNQAVRRNLARFPNEFRFTLTQREAANLKSQSVTSSWGGRRKPPAVFTEHGVSMLSAVLHSDRAVQTSIAIINSFIRMRELIAASQDIATRVSKLETSHKRAASIIEILVDDIDRVEKQVHQMKALPKPANRRIGFNA
jgi:hypothetical protein